MWHIKFEPAMQLPDGRIAIEPRIDLDSVYDHAPKGYVYMGRDTHGWHIFQPEGWQSHEQG